MMKALRVLLLLVPSPQGHPTRALRLVVALLVATFVCVWPPAGSKAAQSGATGVVTVMTQNMDEGSDLGPAVQAKTPEELVKAVTFIYNEVVASKIPERAAAVARQIGQTKPDLVGLTEVPLWRTGPCGGFPPQSASNVVFNALQSLRDALAQQGLKYTVIATESEFVIHGPAVCEGLPLSYFDVGLTDQDVILARTDLTTDLSNVQQGNFTTNLVIPNSLGLPPTTVLRGWASVDAKIRSKTFRFVTTHLENISYFQGAQAAELVSDSGPGNTMLPVVLAGDFNSAAPGAVGTHDPSTAYDYLTTTAGFADAWSIANPNPNNLGYTFPLHLEDQQPPSPPAPDSSPTERIDLVLSRGGVGVLGAQLVGNTRAALTPSGLWPSDHAGVVATLRIP